MRKLFNYVMFLTALSCSGQDNKQSIIYPKEKIMNTEKFDVKRFENYPDVVSIEEEEKLPAKKEVLSNGTIIEYSFWKNKEDRYKTYYSKRITPPPPALFYNMKEFYPTGTIKQESEVFIGTLLIEPFYNSIKTKEYDHDGYLIRTVDNSHFDDDVKIKFLDLLTILKKTSAITEITPVNRKNFYINLFQEKIKIEDITPEKIIDKLKSTDFNGKILNPHSDFDRRNITISLKNKIWYVTKDIYPKGFLDYKIDADTGKIIDFSYRKDYRP